MAKKALKNYCEKKEFYGWSISLDEESFVAYSLYQSG